MQDILINCSPRETRVAVLIDGILEDLHIERVANRGLVGNVYMGRVLRVLPGMQSAFVDIGFERTAFLHILDIEGARLENGEYKPIEKMLTDGQRLLVQVSKDPIGTKGARLTTTISLAGHKLVYLPQDPHIGVSQRIEDEARRENLREQCTRLRPAEEKGGYIVRTCAEESASDVELIEDMRYLSALWKTIKAQTAKASAPSLLYEDLPLAKRVLRDLVQAETGHIYVDSRQNFEALKDFARKYVPSAEALLVHYTGERPLFEVYGVDEEIERALGRRVPLKSGGYLVVDQTEAMTTIDVNTGGFVGKRDFSQTVFKTNLEAAQTIARQLRLRNLGGIIIIDFIDMASDEHRAAVLSELRRAAAADRTKLTISDFTELGLVEMTRKRTRESLSHVLCETCPVCGGRGEIKTSRTVCYEIMREIVRMYRQYRDARAFKVLASQAVIDMFLDDESAALNLLQDFVEKPVSLEVEPVYTQEQYDVVIS
ncbi:MAG: ribonuclease G [Duodenibacillus sp.]|nr:ribonuclease G [Duodenibacillus sp.]